MTCLKREYIIFKKSTTNLSLHEKNKYIPCLDKKITAHKLHWAPKQEKMLHFVKIFNEYK